jgi:hypothetical protein
MVSARALPAAIAAPILVLVGVAVGVWISPHFDSVWVPERFVADRMAECALTVRLHEEAVEIGHANLQQLLEADMAQCRRLVATYPHKIAEHDFDVAARINATAPDTIARR